jgi:hypothetical protein
MKPLLRLVGPWGAVVLAATGLAGVLLAVHGWAGWEASTVPGPVGGAAAVGQPGRSASSGTAPGPARSTTGTTRPAPSASASGPLLSSQPFASYAYRIWPGQQSSAARAALAGLAVTVHPQGTGLSVVAGVNGQPGSAHYYLGGARVYVIEASLGDDSGSSDYNLGDDGIVVTDAHGRIVS